MKQAACSGGQARAVQLTHRASWLPYHVVIMFVIMFHSDIRLHVERCGKRGDDDRRKNRKGGKKERKRVKKGGGGSAVLWLRQDLRLHDNPALVAAARYAKKGGGRLTILFVHSPGEDGDDLATGVVQAVNEGNSGR